jgi:hypothetical protein
MMLPVAFAATCILLVFLCAGPFSFLTAMSLAGFTIATYNVFRFYKSMSFDVFKIGKRYFKPDGWRYFIAA